MRAAAALLLFAPAAAAQEAGRPLPPGHAEQAGRAQDVVDRIEEGDKTASALAAARALLEECLAAGNLRTGRFLAGRIAALFPDQLRDQHRYAEVLLASGRVAEAEESLRQLLKERPTDCGGHSMLSDLLLETGRNDAAIRVQDAHLKEHAGEAGPLYEKARIALWVAGDAAAARAAAADMRAAADSPKTSRAAADWLRANAAAIDEGAKRRDNDREILASATRRLDRVLWGAFLGMALALGAAGWFTRRKA